MFAWVVSSPEWPDVLYLIALVVFVLGLISMLTPKISVEYTFFLFLGLAFLSGGLLLQ